MIKISEIAEKYKDYEIDEKELEKLLVKPKPKSVWDLKVGDKHWCILSYGMEECSWINGEADLKRRELNNVFLTKEEAEFEVERRKCEAIMLKYGTRDMMSLGDVDTRKWFIRYKHHENRLYFDYFNHSDSQGAIWFTSKEIAQQCIDEIGEDRLKKYIFNVKE
jgi:hypothetical protein